MTRTRIVAALAALVFGAACGMGDPTDSDTSVSQGDASPQAANTEKASTAGLGATLNVKRNFPESEAAYTLVAATAPTKTQFDTRPEIGQFVAYTATVVVKTGSVYACGCSFAMIDSSGNVYEDRGTFFKGGLQAVNLNPGQRASGLVVFDVPKGAVTGWRVELRDGLGSDASGSWTM